MTYDAAVIGSGPNGLTAAIMLAKKGLSVILFEAKREIGGGLRSDELTLPGFIHDICSTIHPLAFSSPIFSDFPLSEFGLKWVFPPFALAHPLDNEEAPLLSLSLKTTAESLAEDGKSYLKLMSPFVRNWEKLKNEILAPLHIPRYPLLMAHFAHYGFGSAEKLSNKKFKGIKAKALFAGLSAHSMLPLDRTPSAAFGLILAALGHVTAWPSIKGGSQTLTNALSSYFLSLGGKIVVEENITNIDELPAAKVILCDIGPKQLLKIAGHKFPPAYKHKLNQYRYGMGVFKIDWALSERIPWKDKNSALAGCVHLGGSFEEIAQSEKLVWQNKHPQKPYVILAQTSLFDPLRAPLGKHTAWAYCHVPNGSSFDMTERIEEQIERFAPGFRDIILAKASKTTLQMEEYNSNYVGGDINGGSQDVKQLFSRPQIFNPYSTPLKGLYLCSSSTPPGGGVHGMCGYHAAKKVLSFLKI